MALTETKKKTLTEQEAWQILFPMEATKNYTNSIAFMKKLTIIGISTLTYIRGMFPENSYTIEQFAGVKLRVLKEKSKSELSTFLSTSLCASFEAFEKKYLRQLALCIYADESQPETILESYMFTYKYDENDETLTMTSEKKGQLNATKTISCSIEGIQKATLQLIRSCMVTVSDAVSLPNEYDMSLRLYYYDNITPSDYEPEGFYADTRPDHLAGLQGKSVKVGKVSTPYHKLTVRIVSNRTLDDENGAGTKDLAEVTRHIDMLEEAASVHTSGPDMGKTRNPLAESMEQVDKNPLSQASTFFLSPLVATSKSFHSGISMNDYETRCPCNKIDDILAFTDPLMVFCSHCKTVQHAACFGLLPKYEEKVSNHCCDICAKEDKSLICSDPKLITMNKIKKESLCIYRRTLSWCQQIHYIDANTLAKDFQLAESVALKLMRSLEKHGVILPLKVNEENTTMTRRRVNHRVLEQKVIPKFFWSPVSSQTEEQLSQKSIQQYLLSPEENVAQMEKSFRENINIGGNNTFGQVIDQVERSVTPETDNAVAKFKSTFETDVMDVGSEVVVGTKTRYSMRKSGAAKEMNKVSLTKKRSVKEVTGVKMDPKPKRFCKKY